MTVPTLGTLSGRKLVTDLQSFGLQIGGDKGGIARKGGAGPSDHKTITIAGQTVMVPVYTSGRNALRFRLARPTKVAPARCCTMGGPWAQSTFLRLRAFTG